MPGIDDFYKGMGIDLGQTNTVPQNQTPPPATDNGADPAPQNQEGANTQSPPPPADQQNQGQGQNVQSGDGTTQQNPPDQEQAQSQVQENQTQTLDFQIPDSDISNQDPWLNAISTIKDRFENPEQLLQTLAGSQQQSQDNQYQQSFDLSPGAQSQNFSEQQLAIRNLEMTAIAGGVLSQQELNSGQIGEVAIPENRDEAAAAAIQYIATSAGQPLDKETLLSSIEEMSAVAKIQAIAQYKDALKASKTAALNQIVGMRQQLQTQQEQSAQASMEMMSQQAHKASQVMGQMIQQNQPITGTQTVMTPEIQKVVAHALQNPQFLRSMIFSDPNGNQNLDHTISQIARLAFPGKIANDMGLTGKNEAKQELLNQHSGIPQGQNQAGGAQQANQQGFTSALNRFWNSGQR